MSHLLHGILKKRVITRDGKFIGINKDYSQWKLAKQLTNKLAELLTELAESSTKVSSPHVTQKKKETIQNISVNKDKENIDNNNKYVGRSPQFYKDQKFSHMVKS